MIVGDGSFANRSADAGLASAFGNGLGIGLGDFDSDGWIDVFVANDGMVNQLWMNVADLAEVVQQRRIPDLAHLIR